MFFFFVKAFRYVAFFEAGVRQKIIFVEIPQLYSVAVEFSAHKIDLFIALLAMALDQFSKYTFRQLFIFKIVFFGYFFAWIYDQLMFIIMPLIWRTFFILQYVILCLLWLLFNESQVFSITQFCWREKNIYIHFK